MLFDRNRFRAGCIEKKAERVFRVPRRHRFHKRSPADNGAIVAISSASRNRPCNVDFRNARMIPNLFSLLRPSPSPAEGRRRKQRSKAGPLWWWAPEPILNLRDGSSPAGAGTPPAAWRASVEPGPPSALRRRARPSGPCALFDNRPVRAPWVHQTPPFQRAHGPTAPAQSHPFARARSRARPAARRAPTA